MTSEEKRRESRRAYYERHRERLLSEARSYRLRNPNRLKEWIQKNAPAGSARRSWASMRQRCLDPNHHAYKYYGGRGITFDPRWQDFAVFLEDMGDRPEGMTLDQVDPDGNYCRDNCRWANAREQAQTRRRQIDIY